MSPGAYIPNPDFETEWVRSQDALELVDGIARKAAPLAVELAPKREEFLANSIEAQAGLVDGVATGRVVASDFKAGWWEFGHEGRDHPFLRPAVEAVTGVPVQGPA